MSEITNTNVKSEETNSEITNSLVNPVCDNDISTDSLVKNEKIRTYNIQNLQPVKTKNEARTRGRNGGIKSGEVRRQKKTMRETLESALKIELSAEKLEELGAETGLMNGDMSVLSAIIASTIREAIGGDTKAIQFVRDSIGEQPKTEVVQEVITKDDTELMDSLRNSLLDKVM